MRCRKSPNTYSNMLLYRHRLSQSRFLSRQITTKNSAKLVKRFSIRKFGFQRTFIRGDASITSNKFCGLGQAHALLLMCRKLLCLQWTLKSRAVRRSRPSLCWTKSSIILSRRNIRFCKAIWLINLCKFNKQTTVAISASLRLLGFIFILTSWIFAKMDRDYLTTFMMLVTLSVIFIVNDDSFARKEFFF